MKLEDVNGLKMPISLLDASAEEKRKVLNQCGPDGMVNHLVPNHLLGLDISDSCDIHDWTFANAKNNLDHKKSDFNFLNNMKTQIKNTNTDFVLRNLRYTLAYIYYGAVRVYSFFSINSAQGDRKMSYK